MFIKLSDFEKVILVKVALVKAGLPDLQNLQQNKNVFRDCARKLLELKKKYEKNKISKFLCKFQTLSC